MDVSKADAALEHQALISMANDVFGVLLWSHSVTHQSIDFVDKDGAFYSAGITAFVKVELKSGVYHQEAGHGTHSDRSKGIAIATAQKRAVTVALREALRSFNGEITKRLKQSSLPAVAESKPAIPVDQNPIMPCNTPPAQKHNSPNNLKNVVHSSSIVSGSSSLKCSAVNHTPEPLSAAGGSTNMDLDDIEMKLERKRRQKLKQEEFLKKLKQKQTTEDSTESKPDVQLNAVQNNGPIQVSESSNQNRSIVLAVDIEDEALISTQEMNQMVQSAAVSGVSPKDKNRVPLFSSPTANNYPKPTTTWSGTKENNTSARRLPFKNALSTRKGPLQQNNWELPFKNKV